MVPTEIEVRLENHWVAPEHVQLCLQLIPWGYHSLPSLLHEIPQGLTLDRQNQLRVQSSEERLEKLTGQGDGDWMTVETGTGLPRTLELIW